MRRVEVEAADDTSHPESGRAVLLLCGVDTVPDDTAFYLRPLDRTVSAEALGNLDGEQWPVTIRLVERGLELVVGPELTEHALLKAGAAVEIEMPDAAVWSEFSWPAVSPRVRAKRKTLLAGRTSGDAKPADPAAAAATPAPAVAGEQGGLRSHSAAPPPASFLPPSAAEMKIEDTPMDQSSAAPAGTVGTGHQATGEYVVFYPHARGGTLGAGATTPGRRSSTLMPTTRYGAAMMAAAAVLGLQGLLWLAAGGNLGATVPPPQANGGKAAVELSNFELLSAGPVSPRGVAARDIGALKALENAQAALLTPGAPRDAEEAAFWLRRYLAAGGPDERTRRALTQLGSTFADQSNRGVDFVKARQIWELASAFGDPVAMCFLGTLHENGLATAVDKKLALSWFERAKQTGGCPAVDDAIVRLKQ